MSNVTRSGHQISVRGYQGRAMNQLVAVAWQFDKSIKRTPRKSVAMRERLYLALEQIDKAISVLSEGQVMGHTDVVSMSADGWGREGFKLVN